MSIKLIQPPSITASRGAVARKTENAKVFVSFNSRKYEHANPFRVRAMLMGNVTEQSSALKESQKSDVKKSVMDTSQKHGEVEAMVGLDAMKKANSTLEDFFRSHFMFHQLETTEPQSIFRYLPVLSFTESYIYQMDALNEKMVSTESPVSFETISLKPLEDVLEREGLLTQRIQQEFRSGEEYWALERKLCRALSNNNKICLEDVMKADHLRSFYHRMKNLLLYKLRGEEVNEMHMEFLSTSAFLVEVADDLSDYKDDVRDNSFNILRMFVGIFGSTNAPTQLAKLISEAEDKYVETMKSLDPYLSANYQKICEQGGDNSGRPLGTWNIPAVISDEEAYRAGSYI